MRRRSRKAFWVVVLLLLAVGYIARGRSRSTSDSDPAAPRLPSSIAEKPVAAPSKPPFQISKPDRRNDQPETPTADHRNKKQLHLRVVGVHDGDTLTGLDDAKVQHKVRLDAIDAPELGQPFGQAARKALSETVFGKDVVVTVKTRDKFGRTVGHVLIDGRDVNLEMLEEGMAWHYTAYDKNVRLSRAEGEARAAKHGLWQDHTPVPPWDWRKAKREKK
jgi:endonuclease YncB( thermonuclease family)